VGIAASMCCIAVSKMLELQLKANCKALALLTTFKVVAKAKKKY
jgi:L-serine deaminase